MCYETDDERLELESAYRAAFAEGGRRADPSWYAHRGYRHATGDFEGAEHLVWSRTRARLSGQGAPRGRRKRGQLAFALGYTLGLRDCGDQSVAAGEALLEAMFSPRQLWVPIYRSVRFWLFVAMLFTFEFSLIGAAAVEESPYPSVSAPMQVVDDAELAWDDSRAEGVRSVTHVRRRRILPTIRVESPERLRALPPR